ncbi:hypothetical protein NLM33_27695 [Bradyrhizobium sp. CCGUVB1N3]|uniref:hypothetical protein n=1 Tax=Bradyrhizobium sp. CCGUVB1N3 TaxID=2949629 RepID=UPI0020B3AE4D|nr:hypothetical protein [Bradyrhizobium sp. CCGUVB1N3]MCP3474102.1 hypothetical protein [Bradyrhizobium sp. CCGUVB1N3]
MLMQQICEPEICEVRISETRICEIMPADQQSTWLMPNSDDEALLPWLIPDLAECFGTPVAIEVAGR